MKEKSKTDQPTPEQMSAQKRSNVKAYFEDKKRQIEAQLTHLQQQYEECQAVIDALTDEDPSK